MSLVEPQLVSSDKQDWETPLWLYRELNDEFGFMLDAAASFHNFKCGRYFTEKDDALSRSWNVTVFGTPCPVFVNPPYGRGIKQRTEKAYAEAMNNNCIVAMLTFARTDTSWWHEHVMRASEVRLIRGRIRFENNGVPADYTAPAPSCVVIWTPWAKGTPTFTAMERNNGGM